MFTDSNVTKSNAQMTEKLLNIITAIVDTYLYEYNAYQNYQDYKLMIIWDLYSDP